MLNSAISFLALISVSFVQADVRCGVNLCTGTGVYCCGTYDESCCWQTVVGLWWFWFIWVCFFISILSCCIWICIRRRQCASAGYIIVNQQPAYGSTTTVTTAYSQPPPTYSNVTASAPAYTPAYRK